MTARTPKTCSACGQPIIPPIPDLPPTKLRILETVKRRPGISAEELRSLVWDDPSGGPEDRKVLHVHIHQLNRLLTPFGVEVRAPFGAGAGYRIQKVMQ